MNPSAGPAAVFQYPPVDVGDDLVAAVTPAGPAALDLRTGGLTPVSPDLVGWCVVEGTAFVVAGERRHPGDFTTPCVVGSRAPTGAVAEPVSRVGVRAGGSFVWSDGTNVSAIPAS